MVLSITIFVGSFNEVNAIYPSGCSQPFGIPDACKSPCESLAAGSGSCYVPDFTCLNVSILKPDTVCCPNICKGTNPIIDPGAQATLRQFNIFGTKFYLSEDRIPSMINLALTAFLGIVSFYALLRGMYIGAVVRPGATSPDDIAKVNTELKNLIIGFILAWSFIFIIQFIASILGIGRLDNFNVQNTGAEIVIT